MGFELWTSCMTKKRITTGPIAPITTLLIFDIKYEDNELWSYLRVKLNLEG